VTQLGEVLELMYGARGRYRTLRATIATWRHHERAQRAFEKSMERQGAGRSGSVLYSVGGPGEPLPETTQASARVWLEWPRRCREERDTDFAGRPSRSTRVVDGERWWSFDEHMGAISSEGSGDAQSGFLDELIHMLDPGLLLGVLELDPKGPIEVAGRAGILVRAGVREGVENGGRWSFQLGGADVHELVVDLERGVLLRVESSADGLPHAIMEITEVAFDETFPPETFAFLPPPGETVRSVSEVFPQPHDAVSIDQVAREAPFVVFVPSRVPEGSHLHVTFFPGQDRPRVAPTVNLSYTSPGRGVVINVSQTPTESEELSWLEGERVEQGGQELRVHDIGGQIQIFLEREGTRVVVIGHGVPRDTLIEVALSLVPAPTEPPRLTG